MKPRSKRTIALDAMRFAGYHNDTRGFTRLIIESRVSREAANEAWRSGANARRNGMACGCLDCNPTD